MEVVPQASAKERQRSNVLFHLKHEVVIQQNLQLLKEVDNAGRNIMSDTYCVRITRLKTTHTPEQNPKYERVKLAEHDPARFPNLLEQELVL